MSVVPTSLPWVNFESAYVNGVESTPTIMVGTDQYVYVVVSINVCNTSLNDIFVNYYILRVDDGPSNFKYNHLVDANTSQDILNVTMINGVPTTYESIIILMPGDVLYGYSDAVGHKFDCQISYCVLLESAEVLSKMHKTIKPIEGKNVPILKQ
jgi:hypothetical protein